MERESSPASSFLNNEYPLLLKHKNPLFTEREECSSPSLRMDTPDRNSINTSLSRFEDSPIYNYISSLSPIQPVKSDPITHTFNSFSFSSPPPVFTSPHVNHLKESRFYRRHNLLNTSRPKISSEDVNSIFSGEETPADSTHACHNLSEPQENTAQRISSGDASIDPSNGNTGFSFEPPQALKYNSGGPGYDPLLCGHEANSLLELPGKPALDVAYVQKGSEKDSVEGEMHLPGICQIKAENEVPECDWERRMAETSDMLMFDSPNVTEAFKGLNKQLNPSIHLSNIMTLLPLSASKSSHEMHIVNPVASGSEHEIEDHPSESMTATGTGQRQENLAHVALMATNPSGKMDDKLVYVTHHGMRRRCLDFEMASLQRKNTDDNSNTNSSTAKPEEEHAGNEKQLLPTKYSGDSRRCVLPRIGLHLNALAAFKDYKSIENETMSSGRQPNLPNSLSSLQPSASQEHRPSLIPVSLERDLEPSCNDVQPAEDCIHPSVHMAGENFQQNSPKKKRHKLELAGEGESCKRCNCKKSKCLKLYCECFAAGVYCTEPCSCQECFNKPVHVDTVLETRKQIKSRNPFAFAPKVTVPESGDDPNKTPASARHKRGCNCKKSSCLKKYCECYQGGVGCSISCRCEGCKNAYGRKDGSAPSEVEGEPGEETEACEKVSLEKVSRKTEIQNIEDHPDCAVPTTPLRLSSPMLPLPFSSKGMPPGSFVTTISASGYLASLKLGKSNAPGTQPKLEKPSQSVPDDESPIETCIKTSSPNGKRISSPKCDFGSSPTRRGGRRLILQSIPSFPSLNPHTPSE